MQQLHGAALRRRRARCARRSKATSCATIRTPTRIEIDDVRIRAIGADGRVTLATARRALVNGDAQRGAAARRRAGRARGDRTATPALEFRGEFLHAFLDTERVRSHLPVMVRAGRHRVPRRRARVRQPGPRRCSSRAACARLAPPRRRHAAVAPEAGDGRELQPPLVFITGASSGIGQALAARFYRAGWRLALVARRAAEVQALGARRRASTRRACAVVCAPTCATSTSITGAGRACIAAQGLPDVVIANAGISVGIDTAELDDLDVMRAHLRDQQPRHGRDLPAVRARRCASAAPARWSASPAWPASAACPGTAPTAPARPR